MSLIHKHPDGVGFKVFVQPRSSKNEITGLYGDAIKIKLKAPPVEGAANKMCIQYLAKCLNVPKSSLEILSGHTGRTKHLLLRNKAGGPAQIDQNGPEDRLQRLIESLTADQKTA